MARTLKKCAALYGVAPASHPNETLDCTVRALSVAANVPYARAHALMARAGRKPRKGAQLHQLARAAQCVGGIRAALPESPAVKRYRAGYGWSPVSPYPTLAAVLAAHPTGRLLVTGLRHAFAVIDGEVHDWANSSIGLRSRIDGLWIFPGAQHRPNGLQSAT